MASRPVPHSASQSPTRLRRAAAGKRRQPSPSAKARRRTLFGGMERLEDRAMMAIALTAHGAPYTQNFDTLVSTGTGTTLPTDWVFYESNFPGAAYAAGTGSDNAGDTYSYGSVGSSDRALGMLQSGSVVPLIGTSFVNRTSTPINSLAIAYNGEQWRLGATGRVDRLDFQYSLDATDLGGGTWIDVNTLDFTAPVTTGPLGAIDGNGVGRTAVSNSISSLNIAPGATFWVRWVDANATGADDGLAVDDFSITTSGPVNTPPTISDVPNLATRSTRSYEPITVTYSVADAHIAGASLVVTGSSSNPSVVPNSNISIVNNGATRTVTITPTAPLGSTIITMTVSDGNLTAQDTFTLSLTQASTLSISKTVTGNPGDTIGIPITLATNGAPPTLIDSLDMIILFDPNVLTISPVAATLGSSLGALGGWNVTGSNPETGKIVLTFSSTLTPITTDFNAVVATINATIKATAPAGASPINLVATNAVNGEDKFTYLNEGNPLLPLGPTPTNASNDPVSDGIVTVGGGGGGNQAPVNTLPVGTIIGLEDTNLPLSGANLISVVDADSASVTTTVSVPSNLFGTFTAANGGGTVTPVLSNNNATVTFTGSPTQVNLALATLVFVPAANRNSSDPTLTVSVGTTDGTTPDNDSFIISLTPVNDAPSFTATNPAAVNEDVNGGVVSVPGFITSFSAGPSNETQTAQAYLVTNVTNPTMFSVAPAVAANGTLSYTLAANANGTATFDLRVQDSGGTTNSGVDTSSPAQTITITVNPVNDAPTFTAGTPATILEDAGPQTVNGFITAYSNGPANESGQALQAYSVSNISNAAFFSAAPSVSNTGVLTYTVAANQFGTVTFEVRAQDNGGVANSGVDTSAPQVITLTVTGVNDAPSLTLGTAPTVLEDAVGSQSVPGYVTSFNPGPNETGQTALAYLVTNVSNPGLFASGPSIAANGTLSYTLAANANGTATFDVRVQDSGGIANSGVDTSVAAVVGTINVTAVNDAPTFTAGTPPTVLEDTLTAQSVPGFITAYSNGPSNESAQALQGYLVSNISNAAFFATAPAVSNSGTLTYTLNPNVFGTVTFDLRAQDNGGVLNSGADTSAPQTITITVTGVNDAPSFTAGTPPTILEDAGAQTVNGFITAFNPGPNETSQAVQAYTVSNISNPAFFSSAPVVSNTGVLTYTVAANTFGTVTFDLRVQDNGGVANSGVDTSAPQSITITVTGVNDAPTFTAGTPATILEDAGPQTVNGFITAFNAGPNESGQAIQAYTVANISNAAFFSAAPSVSTAGVLTYTVAANQFGTVTFEVRAQDNGGVANSGVDTSAPQTITITVTGVNDAPSLTLGTAPTVLEDAVGSQSVPGFVTSFSPGPNETGQTALAYLISNVSNPSLFASGPTIAANGTLSYTLAANANGTATFDVRVQDSGGVANSGVDTSVAAVVGTINVTAVNDAPTFTATNPPAVLEDTLTAQSVPGLITSYSNGPSNESAQALQGYLVSNISNAAFFATAPAVSNAGTLTYTLNPNVFGTVTFDLRAQDNGGVLNSGADTSAPQTITLTVTGVNDAPSFTAGTPPTILEDAGPQTVNGFITAFNPGPNETSQAVQAYTVSNISNPAFFSSAPAVSNTGVLTYTVAANAFGTVTFDLRVQDNGGVLNSGVDTSAPQTITITVTGINDAPSVVLGAAPAVLEDAVGTQSVPGYISSFSPGPNETSQAVQSYLIANVSNPSLFASGPTIAANGTLSYTLAANANGSSTFEVRVVDNGGVANGGVDTSTAVIGTINVTPVNDVPSFTVGPSQSVPFNSPAQTVNGFIPAFSTGPANESGQTVTYTLTNTFNGLFSVQPAISPTGVLTYTPLANTSGSATVSVRIVDNGGTLNGGVDTSAIQTFTITVLGASNTAPTNNFPLTPVAGFEDTNLPLTGPNLISVADDSAVVTTVVSVTDSTIGTFLGSEGGGTVTLVFSNSNATVTIIGPPSQVNLALATLVFVPAANRNGALTVSISTTDGTFTDNDSFTINLAAVNDAPTFTAGANPTVNEDAPAQSVSGFITSFSPGPSNESVQVVQSYTVTNLTNAALFSVAPAVSTAGTLTYTLNPNVSGTATFELRAVDNGGTTNGGVDTSAFQLITITVNAVNDAPTFTAGTPPTILEDAGAQSVSGFITAFNAGPNEAGQAISAYLVSNISNAAFFQTAPAVSNTGTLTYTVAANVFGTVTFELRAQDNGGIANGGVDTSAPQTITITVTGVNDAPSYTHGTAPTILEDAGAQTVNGFITGFNPGPNETSQAVQAYLVSNISNAAFFSAAPAVSNTGVLTYTVAANAFGSVTFDLRAQDNGGVANSGVDTSAVQSITITVTGINDAPSITLGTAPTVLEDAVGTQTVAGYVTSFNPGTNETGQAVSNYLIANVSNPSLFASGPSIAANGTLTYTLATNANGTSTFEVRAVDNGGVANGGVDTSAAVVGTINVTPVNDAPSFTAGTPPTVLEDAAAQSVPGFITSFSPGPANESGQAIQAYLVSNVSNAAFFQTPPAVSNTGTLTYTLAANASGSVTFDLRAQDNGGVLNSGVDTSAPQTITITVTGVNDAPTFTAGTPPTILEDAGPQTVNGFITAFSPGPGETSQAVQAYLVSNVSNPSFFASAPTVTNAGVLQYTVAANQFGTVTFDLRAQDNGGVANSGVDTSAPQTITITVTGVNDAPSIILGVAPTVLEDAVGAQTVPGYVSLFNAGPNEGSQAVQSYLIANVSNPSLFASGPSIGTNGTLTYTLAANANGGSTFEVRVVDNGGTANGGVDTSTIVTGSISVTAVNDVPTYTVGPNQTVAFNAPTQTVNSFISTFAAGPANESGQAVSFTVTNDFNGLFSIQPAISSSGVLTYTPLANTAGTATVSVRIVDNGGTLNGGVDTSAIQTFTITVSAAPVNATPTIDTPANVNILEDAGLQTVNLTGISAGGAEVQALTITASSTNPLLIPTPTVNYTSGATGTLTFTPVANANGTATIMITVRDAGFDAIPNNADDASRQVTFTVNVTAVNDIPTFAAGTPPTVLEDAPAQTVNGFITSFSPGPNEASQAVQGYLVSNISNPAFFAVAPAVSTSGTLTYTLAANVNGSVTFDLRAQDNGGTANGGVDTSAVQTITLNVTPVNDAPTITTIAPPAILEDAPQQVVPGLVSSFSPGPSNESIQGLLGYVVSNISNPAFFSVAPVVAANGTLTYTVAANTSGTVTFDLRAQDNGGIANGGVDTSAPQTITITVNGVNDAPSFTAGTPPTVLEDAPAQTVTGFITSFSPGTGEAGQTVQAYQVSNISNPSFFSVAPSVSNTGTLTYTLAPNVNGTVTFDLRAQDNGGTANGGFDTSAPQSITITVTPVNDAPTIATIAPPTVLEDAPQQVVSNFATFSPGPANESIQGLLGYQVSNISNPAFFSIAPAVATNGTLTYTLAPNMSGTVTFDLRAQDNGGIANGGVDLSAVQTVTITVTGVNDAPSFTAATPPTVLEDAPAQTVSGFITSFSPGTNDAGQAIQAYLVANISNPAFFSVAPAVSNAGTLTYTLAPNVNGAVTFDLRAQDNGGIANGGVDTSAPQTITINVTPVNDAPSLTLGTAPTVLEDASAQTVPGYVATVSTGPNEASQTIQSYTITNVSNPSLFASGPTLAPNGTLTYTLAPNANGSSTFEVRAVDDGGTTNGGVNTSAPVIGTITVTPVNDAPSFALGANPVIAYNSPAQTSAGFATAISAGPANESGQTVGFNVSVAANPGLFLVAPSIASNGTLTYTPAPNVSGTATINVSLTDNGGTTNGGVATSGTQQFTITISPAPVNNPPTISPIGNLVISEDASLQTVSFSGITTGGETEILTVTATSSDPTIVPNPSVSYTSPQATGSLSFTPVANANGTVTITVTVRDPGLDTIPGNSDDGITSTAFTVTVTPVNDLPSFVVGANQTVNEDSGLQTVSSWASGISAGPANESSQVLTFSVVGNTNPTLFSAQPAISSTGALTYTPAPNANGTATISVTLSDNAGGTTAVQTFQITVNPVNDAPSFVAGPNQTTGEDSGPQTVSNWAASISAGPTDEASQALTFTISGNSNPGLFAVLPAVQPNGTLTYTPAANVTGTATITLNISDNGGTANGGVNASGSQTFTITVTPVNDTPTFIAGPNQTVLEDAGPQTASGWATAISAGPADEAGQTLTFNITAVSNPSLFSSQPTISPTGVLSYTPAPNANGTASITVTLSDNGGGSNTSSPQTFQISVTPVNDAPSFVVGANPSVNEDAGPQTIPNWATALSAGPADETGQALTFQVTGNSNPALFASAPTVQPNGTLSYTPAANAFGIATITVNVSDNGGTANGGVNTSSSQTFTITVNAVNDAPSFVAGASQTVLEDAGPQTVAGWATALSAGPANESAQTLTFTVTGNTNPALFSAQPAVSSTGTLSYTPAPNANGSATISVQLNDSAGGTSTIQTFTINVTSVNDAPSFTIGGNQTVAEDSGNQTVNNWATVISAGPADEASQSLTFAVTGNTNPSLFAIAPAVTATGTLSYTPAANASGTATITLVLQDSGGTANGGVNASAPQTFTINVTPINDPPDATDSQFNTVVNTPVSGTVSVTDPDSPALIYTLQMLPALGTVTAFNTSTGQFTYTPNTGATGLDLFTFSVTDGTNTDTATVRIVIGATTPIVIPSGGNLQVIGTGDKDTVIISAGPAGQVLVRTQAGGVTNSAYYPLTGSINVSTGDADDYIVVTGITNPTTIDAGAGNDYVSTGNGDDLIIGGAGDDRINASGGNNIVWGDELGQQDLAVGGNDILSSLAGNDVMYGGGGDDQLYPGAGNDYVYAGQGNDMASAGAGNDRVYGGAGNDVLVGDAGDDVVSGGSGNDFVSGSDGNDVLIGGAGGGADSLDGGGGNDLLIGGDTNNSQSSQTGDTNDVALMALLAAWNATHAAGIANGIVLGDDGAADSLTGYTGDDDFYAVGPDSLGDFNLPNMGTDRRFP